VQDDEELREGQLSPLLLWTRIWAVVSSNSGLRAQDKGAPADFAFCWLIVPRPRSIFLFGFAKSARGNIEDDELETARGIARFWLDADEKTLARALTVGIVEVVDYGEDEKDQPACEGAS
jgi:hypothetical protein